MELFDSHVHLDMEPLSAELGDVIERAGKAGVSRMVNIGASLRGSKRSVEIAASYPHIWASIGLHPHDAETLLFENRAIEELRNLADSDRVVAIGEIGLDYFSPDGEVNTKQKEEQKKLFIAQIELAKELNLPIIFHIRDAWEDFFRIIGRKEYQGIRGVVHCFTGDEEIAEKVLGLGLYIGFTGMITFEQEKFSHIREAVEKVPLNKILIETDAPFLAPEPYRGKTNEPAYVVKVAEKIAAIKEVKVEEVAESTTKNAKKLFNI